MSQTASAPAARPDRAEIAALIRAHVAERFFVEFGDGGLGEGDDLFEAGVFDSMALVEFVAFLEERFAVTVAPEAVMEGGIASVAGAADHVAARMLEGGAPS